MIAMNDFRRRWADTRDDVMRAFETAAASGWYITGTELHAFEQALADFWTLPYCAGVGSGQDAVEIALRALGCGPGDRVLTTPFSAFATTLAIIRVGAIPVFADTDDSGLLDLGLCQELLERRSDIRFLLPVHLYGNALDLSHLRRLKERFGMAIVEDCAQSIGVTHGGRMTGTAGELAATSFYPTKNLGSLGDGGAILTADEALWQKVRSLRDYGQSSKYHHDFVGYNSRLDEVHAAILHRAYLPRLPGWMARRRQIGCRYLSGISHPGIRLIAPSADSQAGFHLFPVSVAGGGKTAFLAHLERRGVSSGEHYPILIPDQKAMSDVYWESAGDFTEARRLAGSEVSLPIDPYLTDEEVGAVIEACNSWEAGSAEASS